MNGAMLFGWRVVKHVKSNAIVYGATRPDAGIGADKMKPRGRQPDCGLKAARPAVAERQRGLQRRVFPRSRTVDCGGGGGRNGGDSTGRFGARRRSNRGGGTNETGHGIHRHAGTSALTDEPVNQRELGRQ